jgi:NADP-dependent 3-hydroxy acid dehydrogenase YdfG
VQGAHVVLGARRVERIQSLADELTASGSKALAIPTDVTNPDQVQRLVDTAVQTYGRIDVQINNAGLMPHSPLERRKIDDWNRTIDVNIKGVLYGIAAALPYMQQKSGHIINVSSVAGHKVRPGSAVYAATKSAVLVISEGLRQEVKPYNIRTTVISPGAVAKGLLTRKPSNDQTETLRAQTDAIQRRLYNEQDLTIAQRVSDVAEARGVPMAQVALAWLLSKPVVTAPIIGATKPHHLDDAVAAVSVKLTSEEIHQLEAAYQPHPVLGYS